MRDGRKQSTAELRSDGIAGCLRTPKGGSARQIVVRVGKGRYDARLLNGRECARLMGAGEYTLDPELSLNDALFGFGDAVCSSAVEWLAIHYLNPLAEGRTDSQHGGDGIVGRIPPTFTTRTAEGSMTAEQFTEAERRAIAAFHEWCRDNSTEFDDLPIRGRTYAALVTLDRLYRDYNTDPEQHKTPNGSSVGRLTAPKDGECLFVKELSARQDSAWWASGQDTPDPSLQMPRLIGGMPGILARTHYPEWARAAGIEGQIMVLLLVDERGDVGCAPVVAGMPGLTEVALQTAVKTRSDPASKDGRPVPFTLGLPFTYRLDSGRKRPSSSAARPRRNLPLAD